MSALAALAALADPVRQRLCEHLQRGEATAGTLVALTRDQFGISQPATSRHLRVLREAGVLTCRSEGTTRWYALDRDVLAEAAAWFDQFTAPAAPALDALGTEIARGRRAMRSDPTRQISTEETA